MKRFSGSCLLALAALGCDSSEPKETAAPPPAAPASVLAAPSGSEPPLPVVATPSHPVSFSSADGAALSGELWESPEPNAPALILVHRLHGDRSELVPFAKRLALAARRYSVLSFDLRGHGASKAPPKAKASDTTALGQDVLAAISHVDEATKPRAIVLVGTSVGAALVSAVAFKSPKVSALALISPGEAIAGHELYKPYAEVRNLPTFVAAAKDDTVARGPLEALEKMAMKARVKRYDGSRHSAGFLAEEHPELWTDLETWAVEVFGEQPTERRSLYFAPGKEPRGAAGKKQGG
ncbi:MAG: alpha/beta fold hydrolase [Polyangiaceae bacterium]